MKEQLLLMLKRRISNKNFKLIQDKEISQEQIKQVIATDLKSPALGSILAIFFGFVGADRFYKGDFKLACTKLILAIIVTICVVYPVFSMASQIFKVYSETDINALLQNPNRLKELTTFIMNYLNEHQIHFILLGISYYLGIILSIWMFLDCFLVYMGIKKDNFKKISKIIK